MIVKIGEDYVLDIKAEAFFGGTKLKYTGDEAAAYFLNGVSCVLRDVARAEELSNEIFEGLKEAGFYDRKSE